MTTNNQEIARLRQRLAQNSIVVEFTRRFAATLEADEIEAMLIEAVFQVTGAQQIALHLRHGQDWHSQVSYPLEGFRSEEKELPPNAAAHQLFINPSPLFWNRTDGPAEALPLTFLPGEAIDNYIALPLKSVHTILGVIEVFNAPEPANAQQQADLLLEIAGPASLALTNGMLYRSAQHEIAERERAKAYLQESQEQLLSNDAMLAQQARQLEGVAQISAAASTIQDVHQLLQIAVDLTKSYLNLYHAHIYLLDETQELLTLVAGADERGRQMVAEGRTIPLAQEQSLVARAARTGEVIIINDIHQTPNFLPHPLLPDTHAEMAVAMVASGRVLGVLDIQSDRIDAFTAQDAHIITILASQIGVATENAYRFTRLQHQTEELEKTTTFLDSVIENLPVMLFVKDAQELRFVRWNKAGEEILGHSQAVLLGKNDFDFFSPEEAEFFIQKDREVLATGQVLDIPEEPIETAHQGIRLLHTRKVPIFDAQGNPQYLLGISEDITGRKQIEEALTDREAQLTEALRIAQLANWEYDVPTNTFTFNDQFYALLRTSVEQVGGYTMTPMEYVTRFIHPDDASMVGAEIAKALEIPDADYAGHLEHRVIYADGGVGYFVVNFRVSKDAEGRTIKTHGANQDITERKRVEDAYARQARELEAVAQISAAASAIQETNQLLQSVVDLTKGYFDLYHAHIYLLNEPGDTLVLTAGSGDVGRQMVKEGRMIPLNHERSLVARAARDRQAVIVNDVRAEADFLPHPLLPHTRAEMAVPLLVAGRVLGVMDIQDDTPGIFTAQDANIMATLSSQVGIALQNARSFEQYSQTLTKLNLSQSQLAEALRITQLANWEYDVPTDTFTFNDQFYTLLRTSAEQEGGYTMSSGRYAQRFVYPDDANIVGQEIGKSLTTTDPNFSTQVDHRIIYADGEVGYVTVRFRIQKDAAGQTVKTFGANQIITERKQAESLLEKQARELDAVARISTAASTIQETDHLLQTVVDLTKGYFALYHAHIYLLNEQGDTLVLTTGAGDVGRKMVAEGRTILVNLEQSLVARAARTRQAVIVNDVREALDFLPNPFLPETRAEMAVPLLVGGRALGVLDIQSDTPNQFTTQDANIMSTLASQVGIALQNSRSFERYEQTLAELNLLTRRLTREAWDDYLKVSHEEMQFAYGVQPALAEPTNGTNGHGLTRPIAIQGEVIGKLDLLEPDIDADEADEIIAAVAERLSTHLENLRLTEQTQYALSQTEALYLGSSRVAGANSIQEVMDALVKSTALSQLDRANIILFNQPWAHEMPETGTVIAVWERDGQPPRAPVGTVYQARLFPSIQLFSASHPTLFHDVATDERLDPNLRSLLMDRLGMRCFFVFPFVVSGQWWGFISSQASQPVYLSEEEIRQVSSLADQAATVVQTLRLFEQANVRAEQLAILNEMARDLTIALDVDSALETVHHYTDLLMEARYFYIAFYDNDAQTFTFPIVIEDGQRITWEPRPFANDLNEYIIHSGQGLLIRSDIEEWAKANDVTLTELTAKSWLGMPLKLANTILGVVALYNPTPYAFDQNSFDLLSSVANQGSIAIQNARLFEQTQNALAETETLYRATGDINASRRYYEIINVLRNYTLGQQPVKNVTLNLFDRPWSRGQIFPWVEVAERLSDAADVPVGTRFNLAEFPSASLILNQEEPIFISDLVTDARIDSHTREIYHDRLGANSVIFIPLVAGGQWLGFVDVLYETPIGFAEVELRRMLALTGQAAVATQNLRNLEVAQQRAQEAQARREESELLYNLSAQLTAANTLDDVLRIVMSPAIDAGARSGILALFPGEATDEPVLIDVVAGWSAKNKYLLAPDTQWQVKEHAHLQFLLRYPRSPLYVHDTGNDIQVPSAAARKFLARHGTKALVCLPLNIGRRRLGMILLEWETPRVFTNVEQRLYHSVAGQAAVVVDNRQLLVATQTRAAQLDKLSRIETSLSLADTDEEILLAVLPSCNTPHTVILQYIETDRYDKPEAMIVRQIWQAGEFMPHSPLLNQRLPLTTDAHYWIENPGELLIVEAVAQNATLSPEVQAQYQDEGIQALAILPLRSSGRWQAFITFSWPQPYAPSTDEKFIWRRLLDALGAVVASRRSLLAQLAAREETERLYNASRRLNETSDLNEMLTALATVMPNPVLNRAVLMLFEYDEQDNLMAMVLRGRWYAGFGTEPSPLGTRFPRALFENLPILLSEEPLFFNDVQNDPRAYDSTVAILQQLNIKAMVILPLWVGFRQIGCVMLQAEQVYEFKTQEMEPYIALAGQLAIAVENQRLFDQTRQQLSDLTAIQQTTSLLTASLTQSEAVKAFLPQVAKAVGVEVVNLYILLDEQRMVRAGQYAAIPAPEFPEHEVLDLADYPTTSEAINTRQPIIRLAGDPRLAIRSQQNLSGRTANATIPLIGQNTVMGVLSINSYQEGYTFTPQAIRLLQTLAEQATVVLERVRLLEETTKRARREQILREITAKVRGASDVETVMRTAVHEVGRILGRRTFVQLQKPEVSD